MLARRLFILALISTATLSRPAHALFKKTSTLTWPNHTVPVCYTSAMQSQPQFAAFKAVFEASIGWTKVADIRFTGFGTCPTSLPAGTLAIGFSFCAENSNTGYFPNSATVMLLDLNCPGHVSGPETWVYIAAHEVGHALGFEHEQDRWDNPFTLSNDSVLGCNSGVNTVTTPVNLLSTWDRDSVMDYCGPGNGHLTAKDIGAVQQVYGVKPVGRNVGDFNRDNAVDVLWQNSSTGVVKFWGMNGSGGPSYFPPDMTGPIPLDWHVVGSGDFDGNGFPDLVWENFATGDAKLWLMNGNTPVSFPTAFATAIPLEWKIRGVGDVDGDGKIDIVWQNDVTGDAKAWLFDGIAPTRFPAPFAGGIPLDWKVKGIADFSGDNKADILWGNTATGEYKVWVMDGSVSVSYPPSFATGIPQTWQVMGVADYDNDRSPDILWMNPATGETKLWIMAGPSVATAFPAPFTSGVAPWVVVGPH